MSKRCIAETADIEEYYPMLVNVQDHAEENPSKELSYYLQLMILFSLSVRLFIGAAKIKMHLP